MKLTLTKMYQNHIISTEHEEFDDIHDYIKYLEDKGVEIEPETAEYDMQQPDVRYKVQITQTEIN